MTTLLDFDGDWWNRCRLMSIYLHREVLTWWTSFLHPICFYAWRLREWRQVIALFLCSLLLLAKDWVDLSLRLPLGAQQRSYFSLLIHAQHRITTVALVLMITKGKLKTRVWFPQLQMFFCFSLRDILLGFSPSFFPEQIAKSSRIFLSHSASLCLCVHAGQS